MAWYSWSKTAASNSTADSTINWAEGQSPSSVNDSARAMMAASAKWRDDISGTITTGGTSTAYTVTSNSVFTTLALMDGAMVAFVPHTTNGATVTLNVDGLGAKPLRSATGVEIGAGTLVQATPYVATYYNSAAEWILQGFVGNPYIVPIGGMMPYVGTTAPNSNFVFPYGQAVSRTTYASLFVITSTTFGVGDGVTTFNLPDIRGRSIFGKDDMGGAAASRVTTAGSAIDGTTLGAAGGAQTVTMAQANLPSVNFTVTDPGHPHNIHGIVGNTGLAAGAGGQGFNSGGNAPYFAASGGTQTNWGATDSATTGISVASGGSGTAVNKMPPAIILPFILRVI